MPGFYPAIPQALKISNTFWQKVEMIGGERIFLYSAFYDDRVVKFGVGAEIKIMAGIRAPDLHYRLFCQMWFEELPQPLVTPVWRVRMLRTFTAVGNDWLGTDLSGVSSISIQCIIHDK